LTTLTAEQIANLEIKHFIFHVVHHGEQAPGLFDEVSLDGFEDFFIERIKETLRGNKFDFTAVSQVRATLNKWEAKKLSFVDMSKDLARHFHGLGDKRNTPGVLIVMLLTSGAQTFYSLVKYDSSRVVAFARKGAKAVLQEINQNFTDSPKALQKSALISLSEKSHNIAIIDVQKRAGISDIFKKFLGVERSREEAELTKTLLKAVKQTVSLHTETLPSALGYKAADTVRAIAEKQKDFNEAVFFDQFFGAAGDEQVRETFRAQLEKNGLAGEVFTYVPEALPVGALTRLRTREGITVHIAAGAEQWYEINPEGTEIIIRTEHLDYL
jgi:hypothetical protein